MAISPEFRERAAAAELLDAPAEATAAEARAIFLRRLEHVDFAPPDGWRAALSLLDARLADAPFAATALGEARGPILRDEIDRLGGEFWSLTPVERRERWERLLPLCDNEPALRMHLLHLERGLGMDATQFDLERNRLGAELAAEIKATFPLLRSERTERQRAWLRATATKPAQAREAANLLASTAPALAALNAELIQALQRRLPRLPRPSEAFWRRDLIDQANQEELPDRASKDWNNSQRQRRTNEASDPGIKTSTLVWIVLGIVVSVGRFVSQQHSDRPAAQTPSYDHQFKYQPSDHDLKYKQLIQDQKNIDDILRRTEQNQKHIDDILGRSKGAKYPEDVQRILDNMQKKRATQPSSEFPGQGPAKESSGEDDLLPLPEAPHDLAMVDRLMDSNLDRYLDSLRKKTAEPRPDEQPSKFGEPGLDELPPLPGGAP